MNCYKLNENVFKKIENVLEVPKTKASLPDQTYYKSIYSPATLLNDWYEKRTNSQIQGTSSGFPLSENLDNYKPFCKGTYPDRADYFTKIFESFGLGQELLLDHLGQSYYDNYTTSYDLMYNHLTKGICGPFPRFYFKGHFKPETDLTKIYGNLTQWGLKEKVYKAMKSSACQEPSPVSETFAEYVAYDLHTVKKINDFPNFKRVKAVY